jgi:hypothetical protein
MTESYSDIPWHQKLGTYAGNEIDEALVLPYAALPAENVTYCTNTMGPQPTGTAGQTWQARCMIETGINSIMGIDRTDTLYDYNNANTTIKTATRCLPNPLNYGVPCNKTLLYCQDPSLPNSLPCIEVKLALSMYWNRGSDAVVQRPIGTEPPISPSNYGGYVITDGTTYAPQMPWYMSHYCDSLFTTGNDALDAVCYGDYFSTMNDGFNTTGTGQPGWPNNSAPWSVFPSNGAQNHCAPASTTTPPLTVCTLVMAGFDLDPVTVNQMTPPHMRVSIRYLTIICLAGSIMHWQTFRTTLALLIFSVIFPGVVPGIIGQLPNLPGQAICTPRPYSTPSWDSSILM